MIVGTEGIVKLPAERPVSQQRPELRQKLLNRVSARQGVSAGVVDDEIRGVEPLERFEVAGGDEIDLLAGPVLRWDA